MVRLPRDHGQLSVRWQEQDIAHACSLPYRLPPRDQHTNWGDRALEQINATCAPFQDSAPDARSGT